MKKIATLFLLLVVLLAMVIPAGAVEEEQVMYAGGTVPAMQAGVIGHFDTTSESALSFDYAGSKLEIPYAKIDSYEYSQEVARHLGVLPAIAVGMIKKRQRKHFVRIGFHDARNVSEVAVFEVSKRLPQTLIPILQSRAPQGCKPLSTTTCHRQN
jgi:hypothetical protein